ncbi:vacuolar fusion protein MON1 [Coccidioides immitis RS]|uniref:Vacuolar fusion protein MON1 n=3 Tax=Coccidioides immitis TaxID=5501 RepID=MON1_COCIM|nr:vacuolar fusion protein MON1 [Coccidioides immitis RS]Q1E8Q5.2 RecName: Full=Vacuolar fusion protein MON1 [Coccidioides immitis RS]EAS35704.2 vacuolar fusion protein MON1 [Coccidioides immitis RS]KMP00983.1 vacuolar fusion protein mon1 [Coccidioides immitis RMSCC 2394]TPX26073.1 Vacuolar fusion protein mon1 [Coccidioides immitis]
MDTGKEKDRLDTENPSLIAGNTKQQATSQSSESKTKLAVEKDTDPPLPSRPTTRSATGRSKAAPDTVLSIRHASKNVLQSKPTTAVSLQDINSQTFQEGSNDIYSLLGARSGNEEAIKSKCSLSRPGSGKESDAADSASIKSVIPGEGTPVEVGSIFGDFTGAGQPQPLWDTKRKQVNIFDRSEPGLEDDDLSLDFESEFDCVEDIAADDNGDKILEEWRQKRKHYFILSAAGKPIYTRHGDDGLISPYIAIIQTIISFHQESSNPLKSFSAGRTKIVILSQGPLHLVAISRLLESDSQLRNQLDALYMQILSTLTLPALQHIFAVRPSTDLRRPLQGTESLLSSLADSFTKGSPSTLVSALECLKLRKSYRQQINSILLKSRVEPLLYGLVVAGGRLVSVIRPKKHSLHPGDLQLIFNMIFEADGVKAGGGESWIPICLPGFNSRGYLYMYVSFLDLHDHLPEDDKDINKDDAVAIILISADKESFFVLREMRDSVVQELEKSNSKNIIRAAIEKGRPATTDIVPGTVLRHFLYKSKSNVQFTMSSYSPDFTTLVARRRLLSTYHGLHSSVHSKNTHVKVQHCASRFMNSLAWVTPNFELYCVASPNSNRNALSQSANKIAQWVQQEDERVFIIGGAVF